MPSGISLATHGIIEGKKEITIDVRPTMPIKVTITNPTILTVAVTETNKLEVVVKD